MLATFAKFAKFAMLASLASLATSTVTVSRGCDERLIEFQQQLESAKKLAWLGKECVGMNPKSGSVDLKNDLGQLLSEDAQLHRSVQQFASLLAFLKPEQESNHAKSKVKDFFENVLSEQGISTSFASFYHSYGAFAMSLHRLRWELAENELFVELGKAPKLENQKLRNGLKIEAEYQLHWLKSVGCQLRKLAELEYVGEPSVPKEPENWSKWKCEEANILHTACLTRNKILNVRLDAFLTQLRAYLVQLPN